MRVADTFAVYDQASRPAYAYPGAVSIHDGGDPMIPFDCPLRTRLPLLRDFSTLLVLLAIVGGCAETPSQDDLVQGRMAMLPFVDESAGADVAVALEEATASATGTVPGAELVRVSQLDAVSAEDALTGIAAETGASMIVQGMITRSGDDIVIEAKVVDPLDVSRRHDLPVERGPSSDPSMAIGRMASRIAGVAAQHLDSENTAPWYYSIPTLEAYHVQKRADSLFAQNRQEEALPFLYEAYAIDSMVLRPLFGATAVNNNRGRGSVGDSLLSFIEARVDRLTDIERYNLRWYRGDPEESLQAARDAAGLDPLGWTYAVGYRAIRAGYFAEAAEWLGRRTELEEAGSYWARTWPAFRSQYMMALHALNDHDTELSEAQIARETFPDAPGWIWNEMRARAALGQVDMVRAQLDTATTYIETITNHWENLEDVATELMAHGEAEAGQALQEMVVEHYRSVDNPIQLGDALGFAGRHQEAFSIFVVQDHSASQNPDPLGWLGAAAAIIGETAQAEDALAQLEARADAASGNNLRYQAAIHGALDRCDRAVELYREATSAGFTYSQAWGGEWWHRDWETKPVRDNCPNFQSLMEKAGE